MRLIGVFLIHRVYSGHERTVEQPSEENTGEFEKQGFKLKQAREEECARISMSGIMRVLSVSSTYPIQISEIEEPVRENKKLGKKSQKQCTLSLPPDTGKNKT